MLASEDRTTSSGWSSPHCDKFKYRPSSLVVPSTLVHGWIREIHECWPCLQLIISLENHGWKRQLIFSLLSTSHMLSCGVIDNAMPERLKWVFETKDPMAKSALVITSYETYKARTAESVVKLESPREHYSPPRKKPNGKPTVYGWSKAGCP